MGDGRIIGREQVVSLEAFIKMTKQSFLELIENNLLIVFWSFDLKNNQLFCTEGFDKLTGYTPEELVDKNRWRTILERNLQLGNHLSTLFNKKVPFNLEHKFIKKDARERWFLTRTLPVLNIHNEIIRMDGYSYDITDKKISEMTLKESEEKYRNLVDNYSLGVYISQDGRYKFVNNRLINLTGYSEKELLEMNWEKLIDDGSKELILKRVDNFLAGKGNGVQEIILLHKNGKKINVELHSTLTTYQGRPALMGTLLDVTERNKNRELIHNLAYYDTLTGIPNRNLFFKTAKKMIEGHKENNLKFALMFLDLDDFKIVNDTFGHQEGDELIKEVANKLNNLVQKRGFLARMGGDEFVILLTYETINEVEELAEIIINEVPNALSFEIKITPTIGISTYPEDGRDIESLLRCADIAMYQSKRDENRNYHYRLFDGSMDQCFLRENHLVSDIKKAIEQEQLYLVYQPNVELVSDKFIGVEALIRWTHPRYGEVSPAEFIPLVEKTEFIVKIGEWVLEKSINDIKQINGNLILNVNISAKQLLKEGFVDRVKEILTKCEYSPQLLNLEITEGVALYDIEKTIDVLKRIRELGVQISLDDFGTGYSSLSYLSRLPVDFIKIDRSFVMDMDKDESKKAIIQAMINVAHSLKMKVIAEGIETLNQKELLQSYKCDKAQGFYFSKPLNFEILKRVILENQRS